MKFIPPVRIKKLRSSLCIGFANILRVLARFGDVETLVSGLAAGKFPMEPIPVRAAALVEEFEARIVDPELKVFVEG